MEHIAKVCQIDGCEVEASYWIPAAVCQDETFYLCVDHMNDIECDTEGPWAGYYQAINFATGEIEREEIGKYSCSEECVECNA